jgi:hypothetical protein
MTTSPTNPGRALLWQEESTPAQDTGATPEQIHNAVAMRQALADVVTGSTGRGHLADRIERVGATLVASLREHPPDPARRSGDRGRGV